MTANLWSIALGTILLQPGVGGIRIVNSVPFKAEPAHVVKDGAPVATESRTLRLSIARPGGTTLYGDVTLLYEPGTRLLWWFYQAIERPDDPGLLQSPLGGFVVYVSGGRAAGFTLDRSVVWIRDSRSRVSSLDEGQANAIEQIRVNSARIDNGTMAWGRPIRLGSALPDFFAVKGSAAPGRATIRKVTRAAGIASCVLRLTPPRRRTPPRAGARRLCQAHSRRNGRTLC